MDEINIDDLEVVDDDTFERELNDNEIIDEVSIKPTSHLEEDNYEVGDPNI